MQDDLERVLRVLFDEPAILRRFHAISRHISADDRERKLTVIVILSGCFMFTADSLRRIPRPVELGLDARVLYGDSPCIGVLRKEPIVP